MKRKKTLKKIKSFVGLHVLNIAFGLYFLKVKFRKEFSNKYSAKEKKDCGNLILHAFTPPNLAKRHTTALPHLKYKISICFEVLNAKNR